MVTKKAGPAWAGDRNGGDQFEKLFANTDGMTVEVTEDPEWDRPRPSCWRTNALLVLVAVGVAVGFALGFGLRPYDLSPDAIMWLGLPGDLFMRMLKLTIIPLIVASIITGTATSDPKSNGRISLLCIGFFLVANFLGSVLGIVMYFIFSPGQDVTSISDGSNASPDAQNLQTQDMFADLIRNILPDNIVTATFQKAQTRYTMTSSVVEHNGTNITVQVFVRNVGVASGTNVLGLILISAVVGMAASSVKESSVSFVPFFQATSDIFIRMMKWFTWSTPVGVASLICVSVVQIADVQDTFRSLGMFLLAFTVGMVIQEMVVVPVVYFLVMRRNPFTFLLSTAKPWMTVFGPPSTAIGMPAMITLCEETHHVNTKVSRFTIPFGATICRTGSVFFIALSALFTVSLTGAQPSASEVVLICTLSTVASLAIPSIPSASIVTIIIILTSINIDATGVGLLMALEWFTDRLRTTSNTLHIITCTIVVDRLCASALAGSDVIDKHDETKKDSTTHM